MIKFIIYLLESSAILAVLYLLYIVMMKKETFFTLNRFFLIGIVVFSLLLPLMSFDFSQGKIAVIDNSVEELNKFRTSYYETAEAWEYEANTTPISLDNSTPTTKVVESAPIDWTNILLKFVIGIYIIGIVFCLSKLFWTVRRLRNMILIYPTTQIDGITVVRVSHQIAPFSFLRYAFVHEEIVDTSALDQIIAHEKTHIEQKHSIDLIFIQFLAAFLWFNPLIWKLINSLKTTHEYIADKNIIKAGYSLVDYQTLLLRQLVSDNSYGLVHNFNLSFIKKRITMMKSNKSGFFGKLKVALTITCAILFSLVLFQCNSKIEQKEEASIQLEANLKKYMEGENNIVTTGEYKTPPLFTVANDQLKVNGKPFKISEVQSILEEASIGRHGLVPLKIDGNQKMKKVREFQAELRRLDRRKVIYYGETASGKQMIQPFLVPPFHWANPSRDDSLYPEFDLTNATIEGNVATLDGIEYLQLNLSSTGVNYKEEVYQFVKKHVDKKSIAYLVSVTYDDTDTFENYLTNLANVFQGFEKLYQVRSQEMFGKERQNLERSEITDVSDGVYKAVFIAEK
ncbi:M56 family metallopeptidase [Kordia sp.]|uniref:M56 family metallopeptidase n=1 Tax=Kordia sp. TaxID=1965332 RepID=UPI003D2CFEB2